MNIRNYYHNEFQSELMAFMPDTRLPYFGHSWQYDCRGLEKIPAERRAAFLICLYFTVLADQVMYTHFRSNYAAFESLARYPKFCHGLGQFQKNPRSILLCPIEQSFIQQAEMEDLLSSAMELYVDEVDDFFKNHMPFISPQGFFDKLLYDPDVQVPLIIVLANPEMENDIVVQAYNALRKAVDEKYKN